jgi:hypothetical protein
MSLFLKVVFKGNKEFEKEKLSITFKELKSDEKIYVPSQHIIKLRELSKITQNVISFQNILEIIHIGKQRLECTYYYIILYVKDRQKLGLLIGNEKNIKREIVIGIWPFNYNLSEIKAKNIIETFEDLIKNYQDYEKICLIT